MVQVYQSPSISVSTVGATTALVPGPQPTTILTLATFPKGPDYPVIITPDQAAATFGDPTVSSSVGYTGPWGLQMISQQQQAAVTSPIQFLVCRVGVTRGTLILAATAGPGVTLAALGKYAGSASANLKASVVGTGSSQVISLIDGPTGRTLQVFAATQYDLSSNQAIANAINGANPPWNPASLVSATPGAGTGGLTVAAATAFSAGTDGKGASSTDASIAPLLLNSLWAHADYIWAGYDAALISTPLLSHIATATSQAELRRAILGPAAGTTFAALSTTYNTLQSARCAVMAHDAIFARNPVTGALGQTDGWMLAAAYAGMKACSGVAATCVGQAPVGVGGIAVPTDLTGLPTPAQLQTLGGAGLLYFKQPSGQSQPTVGDDMTTAPYLTNNQVNPFYHLNVQSIDDTVLATAVAATTPFNGQPMGSFALLRDGVQSAVKTGVQALTGSVHNGVNTVQTTLDPSTNAPNTQISYLTKWPFGQMMIQSGFTYS